MMSAVLRLVAHCGNQVRFFPLPEVDAVVGSAAGSDIVLPFPGVSQRHARLLPLGRELLLVDLGSKNGLVCAGRRLPQALLTRGGEVRLGRASLTLEELPSSEAEVALCLAAAPDATEPPPRTTLSVSLEPPVRSARAALRLVRDVERAGGQPGDAHMEAARAVLGAATLVSFRAAGDDLAVAQCWGTLPSPALARDLAAARSTGEALCLGGDGETRTALLAALDEPGALRLAAVFPGPRRPAAWKRDLFDYLARRLGANAPAPVPGKAAAPALRLPPGMIAGTSPAAERLLAELAVAARGRLDVLLVGETGTGKELLALALHDSGPRAGGPFLAINCAALPAELAEAELFGIQARVATGVDPRPGLFERARGGTLLLDEVGELPPVLQAKLLRAIQEREIHPVGAAAPRKIDVRIVSATNRDLGALAETGRFRPDLYYRLRGFEIRVPPLRERRDDIPRLVGAFAARAAAEQGKRVLGVSRGALAQLAGQTWPGNVRELKDEIERAVLRCPDGGVLESLHFETPTGESEPPSAEPAGRAEPGPQTLQERVDRLERAALLEALATGGGNKTRAARALGLTRNGLNLKLKRLGLA